jgi:hypothetical protein
MPTQTIYRRLPVELSDEEIAKRADELAAKELEKDREEASKKSANASATGRISLLKERIKQLSEAIDAKTEEQEIACDEVFDDDRFEVRIVRKDTGEKLHDRPYTSLEREEALDRKQETLPFVDGDGPKPVGKAKKPSTLFDAKPVKVGPKDATPAPDRVDHKGQSLTKVDRSKKKGGKGKSKSKEARA